MLYLKAFIACGLIGLILQVFLVNTRIGFLRLFVGGICAGVLLTLAGLMDHIVNFGLAGVIVTVVDAGEAIFAGFMGAAGGDPSFALAFWMMLFGIFAVSVICGLIIGARQRGK